MDNIQLQTTFKSSMTSAYTKTPISIQTFAGRHCWNLETKTYPLARHEQTAGFLVYTGGTIVCVVDPGEFRFSFQLYQKPGIGIYSVNGLTRGCTTLQRYSISYHMKRIRMCTYFTLFQIVLRRTRAMIPLLWVVKSYYPFCYSTRKWHSSFPCRRNRYFVDW